jgi:hypothetical protein
MLDCWDSADRRQTVSELLGQLGLAPVSIRRWWSRPLDELDGATPAAAWASGHHLDVEAVVASLVRVADDLDWQARCSLGVSVAAQARTA